MRAALWALVAERARHPLRAARDAAMLFLVSVASLYLAATFPVMDFRYTATYQYAEFRTVMRAQFSHEELQQIASELPQARVVTLFHTYATLEGRGQEEPACLMPTDQLELLDRTYFSEGLHQHGRLEPDGIGADAAAARRLRLRVDEPIRLTVRNGLGGAQDDLVRRVQAIWFPTIETEGLLIPLDEASAWKLCGPSADTSVFVVKDDAPLSRSELDVLERWSNEKQCLLLTPTSGVLEGRKMLELQLGRMTRYASTLLAILLYAALTWRVQRATFQRRTRTLAILLSLGTSRTAATSALVLEQTALCLVALGTALASIRSIVWGMSGLYTPDETLAVLGAILVALLAAAAASLWISASRGLARLPVARLLASAEA